MQSIPSHTRRTTSVAIASVVALILAGTVDVAPQIATANNGQPADAQLVRLPGERASVVEVRVADSNELDRLVATGVDLDHHVTRKEDHIIVHAIVTPTETEWLRSHGYALG